MGSQDHGSHPGTPKHSQPWQCPPQDQPLAPGLALSPGWTDTWTRAEVFPSTPHSFLLPNSGRTDPVEVVPQQKLPQTWAEAELLLG